MEKRTYIRQPIDLIAQVELASRGTYPGRLRDFCLGGLFLEFAGTPAPVSVNDTLSVGFQSAGAPGDRREYRVNCRVAGLFRGGMGLEFVDPRPEVLIALQNQASLYRRDRPQASDAPGPLAGSREAAALEQCRTRATAFLEQQLKAFFKKLEDNLFLAARDADNNVQQAQNYDALKEVGQIKEAFTGAYLDEMRQRLLHPGRALDRQTASASEIDSLELTLVDTKEFNDLLSVKKILERAEPVLEQILYDLNKRLSQVVRQSIDDSNNPYGPISVCSAFHESLQNLAMGRVAREAMYVAFETEVVNQLGGLYRELNEALVAHGVLPVVERPSFKVTRRPRSAPAPLQAPADTAVNADALADTNGYHGGMDTGHAGLPPMAAGVPPVAPAQPVQTGPATMAGSPMAGGPVPAPGAVGPGAGPSPLFSSHPALMWRSPFGPLPAASQGAVPIAGGAASATGYAGGGYVGGGYVGGGYVDPQGQAVGAGGGSAPVGGRGAAVDGDAGPVSAPVLFATNALQTARSLFRLHRAGTPEPVTGTTSVAGAVPSYPAAEVLNALSYLQADVAAPAYQPGDLKRLLQAKLDELNAGGEARRIGETENDAIEIIARLVRLILNDALVANGAKQRLAGMEAPLTRLVLQDESFLVNEAHPARRVVNQLGRLDLPGDAPAGSPDERMCQQVDQLIGRIASEYTRDVSVFDDALRELDQMVEQQARVYQENLQETVAACEQAETVKRKRIGGDHRDTGDPFRNLPPEMKQAVSRVMRLEIGDIVGFKDGGEISRQVLAWIADDHNTYVFVDFKGRKASTRIAQELAIALQRGSAVLLSESDLPTMERGLYSVFNELQKNLAYEATHDALTGLANGRRFSERLEETLVNTRLRHARHCLCVLELDNYAGLVSMSSDAAGKSLVKRLGQVLQRQLAVRGYVARLEESRFAALLADTDLDSGLRILQKQRESIEQLRVVWKGSALPVSISVGVLAVDDRSTDARTELDAALAACRSAMDEGGNRVKVAAPAGEQDVSVQSVDWAQAVPAILERGDLRLFNQAIMPVSSDEAKPIHEVLVRLHQPEAGLTDPAAFIRGAQQAGLIADVERWILRKTLEWMAGHRRGLASVAGYAVRLTESTLGDRGLLAFVMAAFEETGVPPGKLLLQVAEASASDQLSVATGAIEVLREYGSRFCLDNFGTGDSTYAYLKRLPVDYIRIDSLFVRDIVKRPSDSAVVKSITEVGHLMQKRIIAAHADDSAICETLEGLGVDYLQGSIFGEVAPIGESA